MPNFNNDILIQNIKQLMKDNGVSQTQLASDLCSNQSSISKCLSGNKSISIESAYLIAHRFGVSIDYLCSDHSEELKITADEEPSVAIEEEPAKTYDSPAQILIKVCTALATIFKTSTPRTYSFELREEVYIEEDDMVDSYRIVTTVRANSLKKLISIESPLGKALMGKHIGDRVEVQVNPSYSYYVVIKNIEKIDDDSEDRIRSY